MERAAPWAEAELHCCVQSSGWMVGWQGELHEELVGMVWVKLRGYLSASNDVLLHSRKLCCNWIFSVLVLSKKHKPHVGAYHCSLLLT